MDCPKCKSTSNVKNGIVKDKQRYKCKDCGFNYTVEYKSTAKRPDIRRFGLMLYLEGLGFHSIGRLLEVSHVAVISWIKKYGKQVSEIRNDKPVEVMELDELHSYCMSKKTTVGFGLQLVEQTENTLISLWETEELKQG